MNPPRPSPYGSADALGVFWIAAAGVALALAATAEAARYAAGAGLLAAWWTWHGPRFALEAVHPAGGRSGR